MLYIKPRLNKRFFYVKYFYYINIFIIFAYIILKTIKMQEQISELYTALAKSNKDNVKIHLSRLTGKSLNTINQIWFTNKNIPLELHEEVVAVLKHELAEQIEGYRKLIELKKKHYENK